MAQGKLSKIIKLNLKISLIGQMYSSSEQLPITTSLPPMVEQLSSHEFGKLIIELNIEELQQLDICKFEFIFLGAKSPIYQCTNNIKKTFQFPVKTTLWHFYQYLKDMSTLKINLQTNNIGQNRQFLVCQKPIQLLPTTKVITLNYTKGNYIANSVELCDIFCAQSKQNKGYVMFKVKLQFDEDLHIRVRDVVDFGEILSNPQENTYPNQVQSSQLKKTHKFPFLQSSTSQQPQKPKQSQLLIDSKQVRTHQPQNPYSNITKNIQNISLVSNLQPFQQVQYSQVKHLEQDQSKMIQDDIDRLIQEMQSKPYDSSRYLDGGNGGNGNNGNVFVPPASQNMNQPPNYMMNTQSIPQQQGSFHYQTSFPSVNSIPVDSRMNRFQQDTLIMTQQSNRSYHNSRSPINNNNSRKYPPIPLHPNSSNYQNQPVNTSLPFIPNQTIYSNTQRSVSPLNSRNRSLTRTQQSPFNHNQSMKNLSYQNNSIAMTGSVLGHNNGNAGTLKIHVHELLGREMELSDCLLRVYVNNQLEEVIKSKGYQQGEVIAYNQKAQLNDAQLCDIQKLRFQLQNYYGEILYSAVFEMTRLISIPKLQGIFMLNLIPHNNSYYGSQLTASNTILKKLQHPPSTKNLRITLSFTQQLEVIQIYMNLSKFSLPFSKCKYKIPLTKQTVEFDPTETHFNIFPHSKAYPKLMIEFWDDKAIIGVCQVGLSQIKTITKNVLECNLQPIYLYDTMMPIKNLFTQNQVGKFKLLVCCGNVRQVQHMLNKTMLNRTASLTEMSHSNVSNKTLVEVDYDKKLGVFVKEKKQKSQIQIQVNESEINKEVTFNSKTTEKNSQNEHEVSMMSENQFLSSENMAEGKGDVSLSKVHSIKLSQQEDIEDSDEDQERVKQVRKKTSDQFMKKKSASNTFNLNEQTKLTTKKTTFSTTGNKQPTKNQTISPPKPLISLQSMICTKIKQTFTPLSQNKFTPYQQLKKSCKPHLLFNFIDIDILIKHMMQLGISKFSISQILQILQPLNGMVNFNLLNDFMMCLEVQGEVKYNLVPNKLFVKIALDEYYKLSCESVDREEQQNDYNYKVDEKQWLSSKYLQQISTLDESVDFNQMRKLFTCINIKISMNDYTLLKAFLQNQKDIRAFLFQLAQSKSSYQQMLKSQKNLFEVIKLCVIQGLINRKKEQQLNDKYEQSILDKLYSSKMFENQLNESMSSSMLSNEHKGYDESQLRESRASQYYEMKQEFVQTKKNYPSSSRNNNGQSVFNQNDSFMPDQHNTKKSHYHQQEDDDDFIINGLNSKPQPPKVTRSQLHQQQFKKTPINSKPQYSSQQQFSETEPQSIVPTQKYKQSTPQISLTKTGQTLINYSTQRTITLSGLQDCKTTCECQLDMELQLPFLKLQIQSPFQKKLYFKESDQSHTQTFEVNAGKAHQDQEIEGTVTLSDVTKRGQIDIAAARFVVIKGIQSVYALKTLREDTFCGLIKIIIE